MHLVVQDIECTVSSMSAGNLIKPPVCFQPQKKTNGAPNGFYGEIDWDRYVSKAWNRITIIIENNVYNENNNVSAEAE